MYTLRYRRTSKFELLPESTKHPHKKLFCVDISEDSGIDDEGVPDVV